MPIKMVPVCPFCGKDLTKSEDALLPKWNDALPTTDHIDHIYLHVWECEGCGFVALWKGNPR